MPFQRSPTKSTQSSMDKFLTPPPRKRPNLSVEETENETPEVSDETLYNPSVVDKLMMHITNIVKHSTDSIRKDTDSIRKDLNKLDKRLDSHQLAITVLQKDVDSLKSASSSGMCPQTLSKIESMEISLAKIEAEKNSFNIIIFGMKEVEGSAKEDLQQVINNLFVVTLGIVAPIETKKIFRLGKEEPNLQQRPRPVKLTLSSLVDKKLIFSDCKKLKGSNMSISCDLREVLRDLEAEKRRVKKNKSSQQQMVMTNGNTEMDTSEAITEPPVSQPPHFKQTAYSLKQTEPAASSLPLINTSQFPTL